MSELLHRALRLRTDEERQAFFEALRNEIVEMGRQFLEVAQAFAGQFYECVQRAWAGLPEESRAWLAARAEEGKE